MSRSRVTIKSDTELLNTVQARIVSLLSKRNGHWSGSMTDLDHAITSGLNKQATSNWPTTPSVLRRVVNTVVNRLRSRGISVKFRRTPDHERRRLVEFTRR